MKQSPNPTSALLRAARITGTGAAFPEKRLTNLTLSKQVETSDEWIQQRTGIRERRIADPEGNPEEKNSALACKAALQALDMAGKSPLDIDAILYGTCTPDTLIPSTACWLQHKLGATRAWAMDVNAACSGFIFALSTADQFIQSGKHRTILVVGADLLTPFTHWGDRGSCILFGDGAGAAVVEATPTDSSRRILSSHLRSDGSLWELFHIPAGGSALEVTPERYAQKLHKMQMKGREIFKIAVRTLSEFALEAAHANQLSVQEIDWVIPHQANLRIIEGVAKQLGIPMDRVLINIDRFGNTSSATIPTVLDENVRNGKILPGHTVLMDAFGAGLTFGSVLLRW